MKVLKQHIYLLYLLKRKHWHALLPASKGMQVLWGVSKLHRSRVCFDEHSLGTKIKGEKKKPFIRLAADYFCWLKQKPLWAAGWLCVFETGILKNKLIYKMLIVKIEENKFFFHCNLICSTVLPPNLLVHVLFFQAWMEKEFRNEGEVCKTAIKTQFFNEYEYY